MVVNYTTANFNGLKKACLYHRNWAVGPPTRNPKKTYLGMLPIVNTRISPKILPIVGGGQERFSMNVAY